MADHKVTVHRVGNTLVCDPPETIAKRGDSITWTGPAGGPPHVGRFLGRLKEVAGSAAHPPLKRSGFTKDDLADVNVHAGVHPVANPSWLNGQAVQIPANAQSGAYSYLVEIDDLANPGRKIQSDPVVIIDDGGGS